MGNIPKKRKKRHFHFVAAGVGGRPPKWTTSETKTIRVPAYLAERLLELAQYMDRHDGELPFDLMPPVITSGHPSSKTEEALCCDLETGDVQWIKN
jgi:hypothetical protein